MSPEADNPAASLIARLRDDQRFIYLMQWHGSKIPRGAYVDGYRVGWMQHGIVTACDGTQLGYYERLEEFGGVDKTQHFVAILLDRECEVIDPMGGTITPAEKPSDSEQPPTAG